MSAPGSASKPPTEKVGAGKKGLRPWATHITKPFTRGWQPHITLMLASLLIAGPPAERVPTPGWSSSLEPTQPPGRPPGHLTRACQVEQDDTPMLQNALQAAGLSYLSAHPELPPALISRTSFAVEHAPLSRPVLPDPQYSRANCCNSPEAFGS